MPSVMGLTNKLVLRSYIFKILLGIEKLLGVFKGENLVKIVQLCATRTEDDVLQDL